MHSMLTVLLLLIASAAAVFSPTAVLVMMTGMGMLAGSNLIPDGTDCAANMICNASRVSQSS